MPADSCQQEWNERAGLDEAALPKAHRGVFVYAYGGVFGEVTWQREEERKWTRDRLAVCIAKAEFGFLAYGCKLNSYRHAALW